MADVIDLDELVPAGKRARIGGKTYSIPGDMPLEVYLKVSAAGREQEADESVALNHLVDAIADLFAWDSPDVSKQAIKDEVEPHIRRLGLRNVLNMVNILYREDEAPAAEENPPQSS